MPANIPLQPRQTASTNRSLAGQMDALPPFRSQPATMIKTAQRIAFFAMAIFIGVLYGFWGTVLPPVFIILLYIPMLVLFGLLLWVMPDDRPIGGRANWTMFLAFAAVTFLWPNYLGLSLPGAPVLSLRRVVGLSLMVVFFMAIASSRAARTQLIETLSGFPLLWKMLLGFALVQIIAIIGADRWYLAYRFWLNAFHAWIVLFFIAVLVFRTPGRIARWAQLIAGCAIIVSIIAIAEQFTQHVLWAEHIPGFLRVDSEDVTRILTPSFRGSRYRSQAIFGVSLSLAEFLALASPLVLHLLVTARAVMKRLLLVAGLVAVVLGIVFTQARLGFVGLLVGGLVYLFLYGLVRLRRDRSDVIGPAIAYGYAAGLVALYALIMAVDGLRIRVFGSSTAQSSNDARAVQFDMAPPVILQHPLFGHGPGRGAEALGFTTPGGLITIDSYLLSILLDYGVVGFCLFYGMLIVALAKSFQLALVSGARCDAPRDMGFAAPLCAMLAAFLMIKTVLSQEENHAILFMVYGAILVLAWRARQTGAMRLSES